MGTRRSASTKSTFLPALARAVARLADIVLLPSLAIALVTINSLNGLVFCARLRRAVRMRYASCTIGNSCVFFVRCLRLSIGKTVRTSNFKSAWTSSILMRRSSDHSKTTTKAMARPRPTTAPIVVSRSGLGLAGSLGKTAGKICTLTENCALMNCA